MLLSVNSKKIAASVLSVLFFGAFFLTIREVFSGRLILPQFFFVGPITIRYYGIIMAIAVATAFYLAIRRAPKYGIEPKKAEDVIFWLIIAGFIGARLYHIVSYLAYYQLHPLEIIKVWHGGLSIYGAILGGLSALWIYKRLLTFNFKLSTLLDWLTPSLVLGQIIGRFGNLFNYEAFGYPANWPWKMFVPLEFRPEQYQQFNFFHPFFLYEILGNIIILFLILKIFKSKAPGWVFIFYILLYNTLRFGLEFTRLDSVFMWGFRFNAAVASASVLLAATWIILKKNDCKTP